jgi:hypothetical protein
MKKLLILSLTLSLNAMAVEQNKGQSAQPTVGVPYNINAPADAFGYTVSDSSGAACGVQFIDISATGTSVLVGDDVASGPITLLSPNSFDLYGVALTSIEMISNGFLSPDGASGGDFSNDCPIPAVPSTGAGARIYALHDDLDLEAGIGQGFFQYFATCPRPSDQFPTANLGCHVFQWDEVEFFPGGTAANAFDVEVILYDDSYEIVVQHDGRNSETGGGSTTGLQDTTASIAEMYACDTAASIPANSAQCFVHPNPNVAVALAPPTPVPTNNKFAIILLFLSLFAGGFMFFRKNT